MSQPVKWFCLPVYIVTYTSPANVSSFGFKSFNMAMVNFFFYFFCG